MKIIVCIFLVLAAAAFFLFSGCSVASHAVLDVNKHIAEITNSKALTSECIAGFLSGVAKNSDNVKILNIVKEMDAMVDNNIAEYVRCKIVGFETNILAVSGKEAANDSTKLIQSVLGMGLF